MQICDKSVITELGNKQVLEEPELRRVKLLFGLYSALLWVDYLMPQYFGVRLGFDLTSTRIANLLIIFYMFLNPKVLSHFCYVVVRCRILWFCLLYMMVCTYTMILRTDINTFFQPFFEFLTLFMLVYSIRYVLGYRRAIKCSIFCAYFLSIYGFVEYAFKQSLYLKFLSTLPTTVHNTYRSGQYRIMGPCGHPLAYGLLLLIFVAIVCIDADRDEIYMFKRPVLLVLLVFNIVLTGSRSTLGVVFLELLLLFLFSKKEKMLRALLAMVLAIVLLSVFLMMFGGTGIGRYMLMQITSVIDQVFGTNYAAQYGVDKTTLQNSENYRAVLPLIFKLDWLNPLLGRGMSRAFGAEINGVYIHSMDNYYVSQYIKVAYPGMISYVLFIFANLFIMIKYSVKYRSGICKLALVGTFCYYFNLWWVDALQTQKYIYILLAIFYAFIMAKRDIERNMNV